MAGRVATGAGKVVSGAGRGAFWFFGRFSRTVSLTIFFLLIIFLHSLVSGWDAYRESGSLGEALVPVLWEVGGRLVSADEYIYRQVEVLRSEPESLVRPVGVGVLNVLGRVWDKVWLWFDVFSNVWFLFVNWKVWFWFLNRFNDESEKARNALLAVVVMVVVQMLFSCVLLLSRSVGGEVVIPSAVGLVGGERLGRVLFEVLPFKGVYSLVVLLVGWSGAVYDGVGLNGTMVNVT